MADRVDHISMSTSPSNATSVTTATTTTTINNNNTLPGAKVVEQEERQEQLPHSSPPPYVEENTNTNSSTINSPRTHSVLNMDPPNDDSPSTSTSTTRHSQSRIRSIVKIFFNPPKCYTVSRKFALIDAHLRLAIILIIVALTSVVYYIAIKLSMNDRTSWESGIDTPELRDPTKEKLFHAPPFLHAVFIAFLIFESFIAWRCIRLLVRVYIYHRPPLSFEELDHQLGINNDNTTYNNDNGSNNNNDNNDSENDNDKSSDVQYSKLFRFFFGSAPAKPKGPRLPSYDTALRTAARLSASRWEQQHNIPRSGRHDRERVVGATGDAEDLEIERIRRLGGPAPAYKNETSSSSSGNNRNSRRSSIASSLRSNRLFSFIRRYSFAPSSPSPSSLSTPRSISASNPRPPPPSPHSDFVNDSPKFTRPPFASSTLHRHSHHASISGGIFTHNSTTATPPSPLSKNNYNNNNNITSTIPTTAVATPSRMNHHHRRRSTTVSEKRFSLPA